MSEAKRISVFGAGSWGVALARLLHRLGHVVRLWEFDPMAAEVLRDERQLKFKLPGVFLDQALEVTSDLGEAVGQAEVGVLAVPAGVMRSTCRALRTLPACPAMTLVSVAKGLEKGSRRRMSEVIADELGADATQRLAVLSGPSHAEEVGRDFPTTVVVASRTPEVAGATQALFMAPTFRVYTTGDVLGVEIGGAIKNVIAIAAGIADGLGFGDNTKAALITRGLAEITRLGVEMGAERTTFSGLSGLGDLVVTCCSVHSRNYRLGRLLAEGKSLPAALDFIGMVVEGVDTAASIADLSRDFGIEMPISREIAAVLFEGKPPRQAVSDLMMREAKPEMERC